MKQQFDPDTGRRIIYPRPSRKKKDAIKPNPVPFEGPPQVFGYVRVSADNKNDSPADQRLMIADLAARNNLTVDAYFQDAPVQNKDGSWNDAQSGRISLIDRPAGGEMCKRIRVNAGDIVIVTKMDRLFRKLSDCAITLDRWERAGVRLLAGDFPMFADLADPYQKALQQMIAVFAELSRKLSAQRIREAHACRRREGRAQSKYAGYGFKWEERYDKELGKKKKHRVADPEERAIMKQILEWRLQNHTFEQIYWHLQRLKIRTKLGTEWSLARVYRAFDAELKLQLHENNHKR